MGCGASKSAAPSLATQRAEPKPGLVNGHVAINPVSKGIPLRGQPFRRSQYHTNNIVGPAPIHQSEEPADFPEIVETGDVLTVKVHKHRLSSISETIIGTKNASTQTKRRGWRKKFVTQSSQTTLQLFPEDELEEILMMDDEEDESETPKSLDEYHESLDGSDQLIDSDDELCVCRFPSSQGPSSGKTDVATQSKPWTCSRSTQTKLSFPATSASMFETLQLSSCSASHSEANDDKAKGTFDVTSHAPCTLTGPPSVTLANLTPDSMLEGSSPASTCPATGHSQREASVQTDTHSSDSNDCRPSGASTGRCNKAPDRDSNPRPPVSRKKEMIPSLSIFKEIDTRVNETPDREWKSPASLTHYLCQDLTNELFKVRAIFVWIALNIRYKHRGKAMTPFDVLLKREGTDSDYCRLFVEMCHSLEIDVKTIRGFAKGHDYRPGYEFIPGVDQMHEWNAVHVLGSWRLIDTSFGSGFTDSSGNFNRRLNEHFFLPDPEVLIWTHYPHNESTFQSSSWQLIEKPISLQEFNALPRVTPQFFENNLRIRSKQNHPYEFKVQIEVEIGAHEPMRYKYQLYPADQAENSSLNHFAFCQLKENRLVGSFIVTPPLEARYFLKVYSKAEREMLEGTDASSLPAVATFLLQCTRPRKYLQPFPLNELPWGPTQAFYDFKMSILNLTGPVINTWGGKRKLVVETSQQMLLQHQMFDADGMEMDVRAYILKEESGNKITFTIAPPRVAKFKFMLFGMPQPKQKGHWRLPLLATFVVDCKLAKILPKDPDPPPVPSDSVVDDTVAFANRKISQPCE